VDVAGGKGPGGTLLPAANGAFATPIVLNNQNTGTNQYYRLSLADVSPVIPVGQTLTIRLYWSCGSSSTGRYSLLRDVQVKGEALTVSATLGAVAKNALVVYPNPAAEQLTAQHPRASQGASVTVFAFDGRKVGTFNAQPGSTETRLSVGQLAPGNYLLLYSGAGVRQSVTITKE
jgi:hypothetical protein